MFQFPNLQPFRNWETIFFFCLCFPFFQRRDTSILYLKSLSSFAWFSGYYWHGCLVVNVFKNCPLTLSHRWVYFVIPSTHAAYSSRFHSALNWIALCDAIFYFFYVSHFKYVYFPSTCIARMAFELFTFNPHNCTPSTLAALEKAIFFTDHGKYHLS